LATKVKICLILFLCLASFLSAQTPLLQLAESFYYIDESNRYIQRLAWVHDSNARRYEAVIESADNGIYRNVLREFTTGNFIDVMLSPGNYRIQIIPYDFRNIPGEFVQWTYFEVLAVRPFIPPQVEPEQQITQEEPIVQPESVANEQLAIEEVITSPERVVQVEPRETAEEIVPVPADTAPVEIHSDFYLGLFGEAGIYSRYSVAYGGGLTFGYSYRGMAFGASFYYALDNEVFVFMEPTGFFRMYLSPVRRMNKGFFLQASAGVGLFTRFDHDLVVTAP
jgi:hypothetical protein